ncbi:MAG: glycosyltransferase [Pirellulales bacterium]
MKLEAPTVKTVSIVMVAHKEVSRITSRISELTQQLDNACVEGEVIVVLDGVGGKPSELSSVVTDAVRDPRVKTFTMPCNRGKAAALTEGTQHAIGDIFVFADVRQRWDDLALKRLLLNFNDPFVGAVSGALSLRSSTGDTEGVALYWKYEKWIRAQEAIYDSVVGVTGAICAVRNELFSGVPVDTILDDVYWPLKVVMRGYRVQHDPRVVAYDQLPDHASDEFRRKIRTLCGNFQLLQRLPAVILPWKNRIWWQFISHKILRLIVPWALLGAVIVSATINTSFYRWVFFGQISSYGLLLIGAYTKIAYRYRISSAATSFIMLNVAAWLAFWIWLLRYEKKIWVSIDYKDDN